MKPKILCILLMFANQEINGFDPEITTRDQEEIQEDTEESNCGECGYNNATVNIVTGGIKAKPAHYPWLVFILDKDHKTHCTAAIISSTFILTAAHCLWISDHNYERREGELCIFRNGTSIPCILQKDAIHIGLLLDTGELRDGPQVEKNIPHPKFDLKKGVFHDIGLVQLQEPITCGAYARAICLQSRRQRIGVGSEGTIVGWATSAYSLLSDMNELLEAKMTVIKPEQCDRLQGFLPKGKLSFCMYGNGEQSPCYGDSGGPLIFKFDDRFYVVGVAAAHSDEMCSTYSVVVYTKVRAHLKWISTVSGITPPD